MCKQTSLWPSELYLLISTGIKLSSFHAELPHFAWMHSSHVLMSAFLHIIDKGMHKSVKTTKNI